MINLLNHERDGSWQMVLELGFQEPWVDCLLRVRDAYS